MSQVIIYTKDNCGYCVRAKELLDAKNIAYEEIRVDLDSDLREEMEKRSGLRTVPQIFINEKHVGGFDDLYDLDVNGKLDPLLQFSEKK